jgi:hypothetical protein
VVVVGREDDDDGNSRFTHLTGFRGLAQRLFDLIFSFLKLARFLYQDDLFCKDLLTPKLSFETRIRFLNVTPVRHSVIYLYI